MAQGFPINYVSITNHNKLVVGRQGSQQAFRYRRQMKTQDSSAKFILLLNNNYLTTSQTWPSGVPLHMTCHICWSADYLAANNIWLYVIFCITLSAFRYFKLLAVAKIDIQVTVYWLTLSAPSGLPQSQYEVTNFSMAQEFPLVYVSITNRNKSVRIQGRRSKASGNAATWKCKTPVPSSFCC